MKDIRFNINLYIIIPVIFAGFSILSLLVAFQLTRHYLNQDLPPAWPVAFWGTILVIVTFISGLLVVRYLIAPVRRFVDRTQTMGVLRDIDREDKEPPPLSEAELNRFSRVFDQVSEILGKVQARELFPEIIGQSRAIRAVLNQIVKVAPSDSAVLISGETGTGKELVAHSIHRHSRRHNKPFVTMNCAAIPEGLLESELFGHEKGAFTGAVNRHAGKLEQAHGGTLFLDEIGDMPLETQAKVLRALEEKRIVRVGGSQAIAVEVRFIAATNKHLPEAVKQGAFREDLFYRLNVFAIQLPPLRQRREDIPLLAEHFLSTLAADKQLSTPAMQVLMAYAWPGNIRELQNAMQSAAVMAPAAIQPSHLPAAIAGPERPAEIHEPVVLNLSQSTDMDQRLREFEKNMLIQALTQCRGVQKQAAQLLGIKERSLWHRLKKYEIDAAEFKHFAE